MALGCFTSSVLAMLFIRLPIIVAIVVLFFGLVGLAAPTHKLDEEVHEVVARSVPAAPHFVIYSDKWTGSSAPPPTSAITGYNV